MEAIKCEGLTKHYGHIAALDGLNLSKQAVDANTVEVSRVNKSFNRNTMVSDISFSLGQGEIFSMVIPNSTGKTSTIRMLMDIIKPDSGETKILDETLKKDNENRISYLPEERELYRKITVPESLSYVAALKNVEAGSARDRATELLKRVDNTTYRYHPAQS